MSTTKSGLTNNTEKNIREVEESILQATIDVVPNAGYRAKGIYQINGVGIYSGKHYISKVVHTINKAGYSVVLEGHIPNSISSGGSYSSNGDKDNTKTSNTSNRTNRRVSNKITVSKDSGEVIK